METILERWRHVNHYLCFVNLQCIDEHAVYIVTQVNRDKKSIVFVQRAIYFYSDLAVDNPLLITTLD